MKLTTIRAWVFFSMLIFTSSIGKAQEITLTGVVRDVNTHQELRGVNVFVKGERTGTSSDFAGRYSLRIPDAGRPLIIVFQHIAYLPREIPLDSVRTVHHVNLQPRVIPLQEVAVEAAGFERPEIEKDLPQAVAVIESKEFEIRGYVDAGDLLRTDHSVQVDEDLSGKKTASIRAGNANEVVVIYDGVKMNNTFDNVFDLSLIDLEDIDRFEIIKGSNTALYGPEAFSGVINILPKLERDYHVRLQQRFGTYRSGNWGLHLYQPFKRLHGAYSFKRGGAVRNFSDQPEGEKRLENSSLNHTANMSYVFVEEANGDEASTLSATYLYTALDYHNERDVESLFNFNHTAALNYTGDLAGFKTVDLTVSHKQLEEEQFLAAGTGALHRMIADDSWHFNAGKRTKFERVELLGAYQFHRADLDFTDERTNFNEQVIGLRASGFQRRHHGLVLIAKYHGETGSSFFQSFDLDASLRHDRLHDEQIDPVSRADSSGIFLQNDWQETMLKFAMNLTAYRKDVTFSGYLTYGNNFRFPTLYEQISSPLIFSPAAFQPTLAPEKNNSVELGFVLTRDFRKWYGLYGLQFSANYFQNTYDNKFRVVTVVGIPVAFYDNVQTARLAGFETDVSLFFLRKKVTLKGALARYAVSEKIAFPFKAELKRTLSLSLDHAGYAFQFFWFKEGDQVGLVRSAGGGLDQVTLPEYTNLDVHLSKTFRLGGFKFFANASGRNLLNDAEVDLQGLALRDRRFYVTVGGQY